MDRAGVGPGRASGGWPGGAVRAWPGGAVRPWQGGTVRGWMRRAAPLLVALVLAPLLVALPGSGASPVRAAGPDLALVTDARYDVRPDEGRIRISLDVEATNNRRDTVTRRYYYDQAYLAVLPGTTGFRASAETGSPTVRVRSSNDDFTLLAIGFGRRLYSGETAAFRITFELRDPGGDPNRDVRVTPSLVAFPVWAFATEATPGSTVSVVFPAGYSSQVAVGELPAPVTTADGRTVYRTGALSKPLDFYAYLTADRPSSYATSQIGTRVGATAVTVTLRAWEDDPAWAERIGELFRTGLPVLGAAIGLPLAGERRLTVEEASTRTIGGYAGLFDPNEGTMQVAYSATASVVLHEAAHAWFNGRLVADRWAAEGFASYYADETAATLGREDARPVELTDELATSRVPLNAWGQVGREDASVEDYGYAASVELARAVAARAGPDGLREVWRAASAAENPYRPVHADEPERAPGARPDWRGLLDLLEERTRATYTDLWRTWVVRPSEAALLDEREAARFAYAQALEAAGDWELSPTIRTALAAWRFDEARTLLARALEVLGDRPTLVAEARAAGLTLPDRLRALFEGEPGPTSALIELDAERAAIREVRFAEAAGEAPRDAFAAIGLIGADPELDVVAAREAFAAGQLGRATDAARAAVETWAGAADVGRSRLILALTLAAAVALLVALAARLARRVGTTGRYATLAGGSAGRAPITAAPLTEARRSGAHRAGPPSGDQGQASRSESDDPQTGDPS